jgi:uncharacterized protein YndB with AHSA1/START domain
MISPVPALASFMVLTFSLLPAPAQPGLTGFVIRDEAAIAAPPGKVYTSLVGEVGRWWNPEHTYSGDASNLTIDGRAGGCFCEKLARGGSVEHQRVVYAAPGEVLRMTGALGPLQASGATGSLTWTLTGVDGGTRVELAYSVGGFMEEGFAKIEPVVRAVLGEQLRRLKAFIETGKPEGAGGRSEQAAR